MKTKKCGKCKNRKPVDQFNKDKSRKDGLAFKCRSCVRRYRKAREVELKEYDAKWYQDNKVSFNHHRSVYDQTPKGRYNVCRRSAKRQGHEWSLTLEDHFTPGAPNTFWQKPCIYGCPIKTTGIDRIDSSRGYTPDNVQSMCYDHNQMKSDRSTEWFEELCAKVASKVRKDS